MITAVPEALAEGASGQGGQRPVVRAVVVWCPDWPVVAAMAAAELAQTVPVAVMLSNRVVACSAVARAEGVRRGLRRREAQGRCPELILLPDDPERDARHFEPVAAAVEGLSPGVEVLRPGLVSMSARGPVRYFGGESAVAERLVDVVATQTGWECQAGIADGLFAATLAARRGLIVPAGQSAEFLAPLAVGELELSDPFVRPGGERAELVDLLRRLGLSTLGAFAAVPARDVRSRFSVDAVVAHLLARGLDPRPTSPRRPAPELTVSQELDPPVDRIDSAAFAARSMAERLHEVLARSGLACAQLGIVAVTERGERLFRTWRHDGALSAAEIGDRVRWQLDGWLTSRRDSAPTSAIVLLQLVPEEVIEHAGLQLSLWGGLGKAGDRANRALTRVQGMLGPEAVLTPVLGGGRGPADQARWVPWRDERTPKFSPKAPWPGRIPVPSPATVLPAPAPAGGVGARSAAAVSRPVRGSSLSAMPTAELRDAKGFPVAVTARLELTGLPATLVVVGQKPRPVRAWAGPWPVDERWWDQNSAHRQARFQVVVATSSETGISLSEVDSQIAVDSQIEVAAGGRGGLEYEGTGLLLVLEGGQWSVEAVYD